MLNGEIERDCLAVNLRGDINLPRLFQQPCFAEVASTLGNHNVAFANVQREIIADATTDGTGNVMNDFGHTKSQKE